MATQITNGLVRGWVNFKENLISRFVSNRNGSDRNLQQTRRRHRTGFLLEPSPWRPRSALCSGIEAEVNKGVVALAGFHDDVASLAAVAARRSAARDKLFPAKGHAAIAAVPRPSPEFLPHR